MKAWNRLGWARRRSALVVLIAGLLTSAAVVLAVSNHSRNDAGEDLAREADVIRAVLSETMGLAVSQLRSLQGLFAASEAVTAVEFARFAIRQGASPGMIAVGYAEIVTEGEFDDWLSAGQEDRSYFQVLGSDRRPVESFPPERALLAPIWYTHQHETRPGLLGVDLAEDPARRETIERALALGRPVVTDVVSVLGDTEGQNVEIYAPVALDNEAVGGLVFATIEVDVMAAAVVPYLSSDLALSITDITDSPVAPVEVSEPRNWVGTTEVSDRTWQVEITSGRPTPVGPWLIWFLLGALISLLCAAVTGLAATSRQRDRQIDQLHRSTAEKDIFLASVAHELRTPLTSVVGMTAILTDDWSRMGEPEVDELLRIAHSEAVDLSDLIEDLLLAGRLRAGAIHYRREAVDLATEVRRVAGRLSTSLDLDLGLQMDGPYALADSLRVRQVTRNLLGNAVRYGERSISVSTTSTGATVDLIVSNDGPPIPSHVLPGLFEPYSALIQRAGQPGSIGLGLHISRLLARAMGGDLQYDYIDGWCRFTFRLPAFQPPPLPAAVPSSRRQEIESRL